MRPAATSSSADGSDRGGKPQQQRPRRRRGVGCLVATSPSRFPRGPKRRPPGPRWPRPRRWPAAPRRRQLALSDAIASASSRDGSSLATRRGASKPHGAARGGVGAQRQPHLQTTLRGPRCSPSRTAASSTMFRGCLPNGGTGEDVFGGEQVDEAHRGLLLRQTSYQNSSCHHRTKTRRQAPSFPGTSCLGGGEGEDC